MTAAAAGGGVAGSSSADLVNVQKGGVQTLAGLFAAVQQGLRPAVASASPLGSGFNNIGAPPVQVLAASTVRHGLMFCNPGTTTVYVYPSTLAITSGFPEIPGVSAGLGGAFPVAPGGFLSFPALPFANCNCGWFAFAPSGSSNPLSILEFL